MRIKIKHAVATLVLIDAMLLVINVNYKDDLASVIPHLDKAKLFFCLGIIGCIAYVILVNLKKLGTQLASSVAIISFGVSLVYNLRLAKGNYDRIQCNDGISEYFEFESCENIKEKFEEDLLNGDLKYFQSPYDSHLEFEAELRDKHGIKLIGIHCTQLTAMTCYNDFVEDYITQKKRGINHDE